MKTQVISLLIRVVGAVLSVGQTVILARFLGPADLGAYSAIIAITAVLAVPSAAGMPPYLTREVAHRRKVGDFGSIYGLLRSANFVAVLIGLAAIVVLLGLFNVGILAAESWVAVLASALLVPLLSADLIRAGAMRGLGSALNSQVPENLVRPGSFLVILGVLALVNGRMTVSDALLALAGAGFTSMLVGQVLLRRALIGIQAERARVPLCEVWKGSAGLALLGGTQTLIANLDIALLSLFGLMVAAGNYRVALIGIVALLFVYNSLTAVASRDFAISLASQDKGRTIAVSDRVTLYGFLATSAIVLTYILFAEWGVQLVFGEVYLEAAGALVVLAVGHLVAVGLGPSLEIVMLVRGQSTAIWINLGSIVLVIGLSLLLIEWDPVLGVAIASSLGNISRRMMLSLHIKRTLEFDPTVLGVFRRWVTR